MRATIPILILVGVLIALLVLTPAAMGEMMRGGAIGPGMMWGYGRGIGPATGGWGGPLGLGAGWLMMLLFWSALIVVVVLLVRWASSMATSSTTHENPLTILQRRYAAGEIDEETYRRMRRELGNDPPADLPRAS